MCLNCRFLGAFTKCERRLLASPRTYARIEQLRSHWMYRVSIKSFPDYKHLLQENWLEYKHIFLPLLKLVVKKLLELSYI